MIWWIEYFRATYLYWCNAYGLAANFFNIVVCNNVTIVTAQKAKAKPTYHSLQRPTNHFTFVYLPTTFCPKDYTFFFFWLSLDCTEKSNHKRNPNRPLYDPFGFYVLFLQPMFKNCIFMRSTNLIEEALPYLDWVKRKSSLLVTLSPSLTK